MILGEGGWGVMRLKGVDLTGFMAQTQCVGHIF